MLLGAHVSIAGGLDRALLSAAGYGFNAVALFLRNQVQWRCRPLAQDAVAKFRRTRRRTGIAAVVAHGSYLVNLAGFARVRRRSITATIEDLDRCGRLGIEHLVIHPGSRPDADKGIALIAEALDEILASCPRRRPKILLETTAGAGNTLGRSFEQIAAILARVARPRRLGVCLDTCHAFAAGYDFRTPAACRNTLESFDRVIGLDRLHAVHLNDSLRPLGSRVDRHAHIGRGEIGLRGFGALVRDARLHGVPMILETPKGTAPDGRDWDAVNAETIRRLAKRRRGR